MNDQEIYRLAHIFKDAALTARDAGLFRNDVPFRDFPNGCCGDTCYLLATFLLSHGIETIYVCGTRGNQSHAWLVVNDNRVKQPTPEFYYPEKEYVQLIGQYGMETNGPIDITRYKARDLTYGLFIDITADQFGEPSVYACSRNDFYRKFTFDFAHVCNGVDNYRLRDLYSKIIAFLPTR